MAAFFPQYKNDDDDAPAEEQKWRPVLQMEENFMDPMTPLGDLELGRPFVGMRWWNSLMWTNFPKLSIIDPEEMKKGRDKEMYKYIGSFQAGQFVSQLYVSFDVARKDLCTYAKLPSKTIKIRSEVFGYDGQRRRNWSNFPLLSYIPNRDNHMSWDAQGRRFYDNGQAVLGLNAAQFSQQVLPASSLDCSIHIADYLASGHWGYFWTLLRIGGWPYRIKKIGRFVNGVNKELTIGFQYYDENKLWKLLEGSPEMAPTGPNGEMEWQKNPNKGVKFWCQLYDLDYLGQKRSDLKLWDPEVPDEKGYIWFEVVETITMPDTGLKAVRVQLTDEGILPAWMDLKYLQVFVGTQCLGYLNSGKSEETDGGNVTVHRVPSATTGTVRKVVTEDRPARIVHSDPASFDSEDLCDFGWRLKDLLFRGADMVLGPKTGDWHEDLGQSSGIWYRPVRPPPLIHGDSSDYFLGFD